jgi:hypothetical protein
MSLKRTYSTAGAARRRVRRENSISSLSSEESQSLPLDNDDVFGFDAPTSSQSSQLDPMLYHKMSSDTRRSTSLNTKSAGRIRAQMDDLQFNLEGLATGSVGARRQW